MTHKARVTKALLACGLLVYATSVFLPWFESSMPGGPHIIYWSFKAVIYPYPYPDFPSSQLMFFDYWCSSDMGAIFFVSQILTFLFWLLTLLKKPEGKYEAVLLELTLLFSAASIGIPIVNVTNERFITNFGTGFWIASIAFLLLIASLGTSLIK